jgi:hypothetical protein
MFPDPTISGRELKFSVILRNEGRPVQGNIRIENNNQTVTRIEYAAIPRGVTEFQFPRSQYAFQPANTCLTVFVDIDRMPNQANALGKEYCLKSTGWSLKSGVPEHRDRDERRR